MTQKILSAALTGIEAAIVEIEADAGGGDFGQISIVGLPDTAISEARERIKSAIRHSGLIIPRRKIIVNLAPANLRKRGAAYDLPIALSILALKNSFPLNFSSSLFIGELALDGTLRPIAGTLAIAIKAKEAGLNNIFLPRLNASEASLVDGLKIFPLDNLYQLIKHLKQEEIIISDVTSSPPSPPVNLFDLAEIKGQPAAKRALEICAAGNHNLLMTGPPGSGKTRLAKCLPAILPDLNPVESLEVTKVYSVAEKLDNRAPFISERPFRAPHHTASASALVGGGSWPRPGDISLAHRGVLFLDELSEFSRFVLESLRQPLEEGVITISRAAGSPSFPAKFLLIAAMNPCPCGYYGDPEQNCTCPLTKILNYRKRISGPLLDRFDLQINLRRVSFSDLNSSTPAESSMSVKARIQVARTAQAERFRGSNIFTNAEMEANAIRQYCSLDTSSTKLIGQAVESLKLSARAYFRTLKLARTIADLDRSETIRENHLSEALSYRPNLE